MVSFLVRPVRKVVDTLIGCNLPRELAAGFALGMVLGLVPKGNLIAVSLVVLLFSLRVNTGVGLVAALLFSWTGAVLDPFAHKTGLYVLSIGSLQATYASVLQMPLGPWTGFNNTVVAGSLAIGLYLMYPAYWLSHLAFSAIGPTAKSDEVPPVAAPRLFASDEPTGRRAA